MNRSGQPVASLMGYYKVAPQDVIVVHDELALDFGVVRCKKAGGHGGHNGLRDIIKHIGNGFLRVRIGIGAPKGEQSNYVLSQWSSDQKNTIHDIFEKGCNAVEMIISDGIMAAMNTFNVRN